MAPQKATSPIERSQVKLPVIMKSTQTPDPAFAGFLSQTLHTSSTIRYILPARIRSKRQNDVVFVGESSIQLREFLPSGQLADVSAKVDLGAQILAARVISTWTEPLPFVEQVIKQECEDDAESDCQILPSELLVISMASSELIFLYARDTVVGTARFIYAKRKLPADVALPERFGKHLTVDYRSRAMALAPSNGFCAITDLRSVAAIIQDVEKWTPLRPESFDPCLEERFIEIDGLILKTEFLPPPVTSPASIILIILVAEARGTSLLIYRWDARLGVRNARPARCSGQILPVSDSLPLMLIPSSACTSFIIVTETTMVAYDDILSTRAKRISKALPSTFPVKYENSTTPPLWVQWAKPHRHERWKRTHDDLILVREDGELHYFEIDHTIPTRIEAHYTPGQLGTNVDSAFAMLPGPPATGGGDTILVGGDFSDGGVYQVLAKTSPTRTQTIQNLAPIHDFITINSRDHPGSKALLDPDRSERMFICSGRGTGHTSISEVRYGLEAKVGLTADYDELSSVDDFWILHDAESDRLVLLISQSASTSAMSYYVDTLELELSDHDSCPGLDFASETLAAATTPAGLTIQITTSHINLTTFSPDIPPLSRPHVLTGAHAATINDKENLAITATKASSAFQLQLISFGSHGQSLEIKEIEPCLSLPSEPTCLSLARIGGKVMLFAGHGRGSLTVLSVDRVTGLNVMSEHPFAELFSGAEPCAINALSVISRSTDRAGVVVCGLRNGSLACIDVRHAAKEGSQLILSPGRQCQIGRLPVEVVLDSADETSALVHCERILCRVSMSLPSEPIGYSVLPVWLTTLDDPAYQQPAINAISRMPALTYLDRARLSGQIVCLSDRQLLFASFMTQPQTVTRRIRTTGNPKRLAYAKSLNRIVTAVAQVEFDEVQLSHMSRSIRPAIQFIDPDRQHDDTGNGETPKLISVGELREKINALLVWTPIDGVKHYEMIMLGIQGDSSDMAHLDGRLASIRVKQHQDGADLECRVKTVGRFPGQPVTAICPFRQSSLLVCAGTQLRMQHLDMETKKWTLLGKFDLPSAAVGISTRGPVIHVATTHHSMTMVKFAEERMDVYASDVQARNTTSMVTCRTGSAIIAAQTETGGQLIAFAEQVDDRETQTLVDVSLPLIINRFISGYTPPSKHDTQHFYGSTLDGTVYRLTTLNHAEWRLLHFLETLTKTSRSTGLRQGRKRRKAPTRVEGPTRHTPSDMHINGDRLAKLFENGPSNISNILWQPPDLRNASENFPSAEERYLHFEDLVAGVLGQVDDTVTGVTKWVRELMQPDT